MRCGALLFLISVLVTGCAPAMPAGIGVTEHGALAPADASAAICPPAPERSSEPTPVPGGYPGQSNAVPPGYPTPNTWAERLRPLGPARDPGSLDWARPGPYVGPRWTDFGGPSFGTDQRVVTTFYFYWHDLTNPARRGRYDAGEFKRPPDMDRYSFALPETHYREFTDMLAAGVDFVLPVYWGAPGHPGRTNAETCPRYWSTDGIPPMVEALDALEAEGTPLKMGMFYDTTILANADLTTTWGMEYFYINVRDFFSRVPPRHWAAIDGQPIVWLYDAWWASAFDQSSFDHLTRRFATDFGALRPYVVREQQWDVSRGDRPPRRIETQGRYAWGAAVFGFNPDPWLTVAQVGPGFTNVAYCRSGPGCHDVDREEGAFYERALREAMASDRNILALETWNEFSEGTQIAETVQDGRFYIEMTRRYADRFREPVGR
jgi:hypothetical protein